MIGDLTKAVRFCVALSAGAAVSATVLADQVDDVKSLLSSMSSATRHLDYEGLFTFEVGGSLDTYKIVHRIEGNKEFERLQRLNGQQREIVRSGQSVDCLSPGNKLLQGLIGDVDDPASLLENYRFVVHDDERIAERSAAIVQLLPIDNDRYGYTLGIDQATHLPLKILLIGPNRLVLERFQFVELKTGANVESAATESTAQVDPVQAETASCDDEPTPVMEDWSIAWLPKGFVFAGERRTGNGDHMLTFTDGLATFSVFISSDSNRPPVMEARARLGATTAFMARRVWGQTVYSVTVVGEIPAGTAQRVVSSINPK